MKPIILIKILILSPQNPYFVLVLLPFTLLPSTTGQTHSPAASWKFIIVPIGKDVLSVWPFLLTPVGSPWGAEGEQISAGILRSAQLIDLLVSANSTHTDAA